MKHAYKSIKVLFVFIILLNAKGWLPEAEAQTVNFPDANLAAAVRDELGLGPTDPITQTDLNGLQALLASNAGIRDLTGLEAAINIHALSLSGNQISDITPLSGLTLLTSLGLINNQISDISPLSGLTLLTNLELARNQISDISPLSGLTSVGRLTLKDNQISDISPLSGLTSIVNLSLRQNQISDIRPLSGLMNIRYLHLDSNQISDLTPLSGLTLLETLSLADNQISDLTPLSGLTEMKDLGLANNQVSDIRPLSRLTEMKDLGLGHNRVRDIRPLSRLTKITNLIIISNPITDIRPLANLVNLEVLQIDAELDKENPGVLRQILLKNIRIFFQNPINSAFSVQVAREELSRPKPKRKVVSHSCGLGWSPLSQYGHRPKPPKAMIYALEFEYKQDPRARYLCTVIEIRTGDPEITDLDGWKLYLGTLYNQNYRPIRIKNSEIDNGVLRLTPDMLGLEKFACSNAYIYSQAVPSVFYELRTENNITVDRAYSCFLWGQSATMQINGIWTKSERRISPRALREMDTPRIERYIIKTNSVYITHTSLEEFQWDRFVLSDWLLPAPDEPEVAGGNAPSVSYRKLTTSWAALKK